MKTDVKCRLRKIIAATVLLPMLLLSSCLRLPFSSSQSAPPTPVISTEPAPSKPAASEAPATTDWDSGVKTDYSGLTPYQPPAEKYTRISDGALPALTPSGSYGKLLPYVGESLFGDGGYNSFNLYGLVTEDARIVTDPVYSRVYQAGYYDYGSYTYQGVPVYDLEALSDKIDKTDPWKSIRHAVCALDGSWITGFDYRGIFCTDTVIMCTRDYEKNDVDFLDYSGKLLYNSKSLGCYSAIPPQSAYSFQGGYGEGLIAVPLSTGKTVYIDAKTGAETMTDYVQGEAFYGGFARVRASENGLIGYINRSFETVIKPQYMYADFFCNRRSVVQFADNSYAVIDETGAVLLENPYIISRWDKSCFGVYDANNSVRYYDGSFNEITADGTPVTPLYDGWFFYTTNRGTVLIKGNEKYVLNGVKQVSTVVDGLFSYYDSGKETWSEGVKTLSGETVVPLTPNISPSIVKSKNTGEVFIIVSSYGRDAASQSFSILTAKGEAILTGKGYATFDENNDLFQVNDTQSFGYADLNGDFIFRLSLLQYVPD